MDDYQLPTEGAGAHPLIVGSGWQNAWSSAMPPSSIALEESLSGCAAESTWTADVASNERLPINCVIW